MSEILLSSIYHLLILSPGLIIIFLLVKYDKFPEPLNLLIITVLLAFAGTTLFATIKYDILLVNEWFPGGNSFLAIDPETNYIIPESSNYLMYYLFHAIDAYILVAFGEDVIRVKFPNTDESERIMSKELLIHWLVSKPRSHDEFFDKFKHSVRSGIAVDERIFIDDICQIIDEHF